MQPVLAHLHMFSPASCAAFFDLFKLGMVLTATYQFNVNSGGCSGKALAGSGCLALITAAPGGLPLLVTAFACCSGSL